MIKPKKSTRRVQIDLPDRSMERLEALKDKTEAASYAEVLKNSLRLYEIIVSQYEAGNKLYVKDENGNQKEYEIFC